jgi:regulator of replication initiation timing
VVKVDRAEWEALKERERTLADSNKSFALENNTLKANLSATQQEIHRLIHGVIPQMQSQVVAASEQAQRYYREAERQQQRAGSLERENKELRAEIGDLRSRVAELRRQLDASMGRRVAELLKEVEYWKDQYRRMKTKHDSAWRQYDELCASVRLKSEKLAVYEDILRRRGLI